jgi:nucleoside-diphosphate-sugar epimerase
LFPQSPYAETKISEEEIRQKYEKSIILRLGTIVGPSQGMRFHTAVNSFIWKALINQPIQIWKTAYNQKRPYLCLKDFVNLIQFVLNKDLYYQSIFNILNENSTPKIITDEIRIYIPNLEIEFVDSKIMNQLTYEVSKELIENEGFIFKSSIQEGIKETIEFLVNEKYS